MSLVGRVAMHRFTVLRISSCVCRRFTAFSANDCIRKGSGPRTVFDFHKPNHIQIPTVFHCQVRNYAKGKDKKGKGKQGKVHVTDMEMSEVINVTQLRGQLAQILDNMKEEYIKSLTLRTATGGIDNLPVELEGDKYPLNEVAQISRKSPQLMVISAAAFPQAAGGIVQAIKDSGMNLNPQQEGTTIYLTIPKVTREHRENLAKSAKVLCNRYKDQLRDSQNNFIRKVKNKEGSVSEDLIYDVQLKIREIGDEHMQEAEKLMTSKQKELLKTS